MGHVHPIMINEEDTCLLGFHLQYVIWEECRDLVTLDCSSGRVRIHGVQQALTKYIRLMGEVLGAEIVEQMKEKWGAGILTFDHPVEVKFE